MLRFPELGRIIREARIARRLTQQELAISTGLSRMTLNQLENGVFPDLGIRKVGTVLDTLGLELHVQPVGHPKKETDFLAMASNSASVSLKGALLPDELEHALLSGKIPSDKKAHLITLLEEAPAWMLQGLVQQVGSWAKPGKVQKNLHKLAQQLGISPEVGHWQSIA
jgi:transcriptional regulator with XRE-family HTH domain